MSTWDELYEWPEERQQANEEQRRALGERLRAEPPDTWNADETTWRLPGVRCEWRRWSPAEREAWPDGPDRGWAIRSWFKGELRWIGVQQGWPGNEEGDDAPAIDLWSEVDPTWPPDVWGEELLPPECWRAFDRDRPRRRWSKRRRQYTIRGVIASRCNGYSRPPTADEIERGLSSEHPTRDERRAVASYLTEADELDIWRGWMDGAYSMERIVKATHEGKHVLPGMPQVLFLNHMVTR